ncbi:hypothetical protein P5V15_004436 [Pogonomyrmex californicus]
MSISALSRLVRVVLDDRFLIYDSSRMIKARTSGENTKAQEERGKEEPFRKWSWPKDENFIVICVKKKEETKFQKLQRLKAAEN